MRAIDKAMMFYNLPRDVKNHHISRIMKQSHERFDHAETVENYLLVYEKMLNRPICESKKKGERNKMSQRTISWLNGSNGFDFMAQKNCGPDVFRHQPALRNF
ncbi:hypothetical protein [uncultured Desulfobacter sp.]|uniref:hypothetical protein n=1 Tax=uncultured Desulfobacter sp. TaxID=240139 RepID=UPI002AABC9E3|nr:hypothetical protein [uncultured Desulfobacter sp.]